MGFALSDMQLSSSAFEHGAEIPRQFTGEGEDVSPLLQWQNAPAQSRSFALICHDPDAPLVTPSGGYGFVHWLLYNIPGTVTELAQACKDYTAGLNDFGHTSYGGPMPPPGHGRHHYFFWLLALQQDSDLPAGLSLSELLQRIEPDVIAMNRLMGCYSRA